MKACEAIHKARSVIRRQLKALSTEETYIFWLRRGMRAVQRMPKDLPSEQKLERFLTELACKHDLSAGSQNQAFNAILFFYRDVLDDQLGNVNALRAQRPLHERHAPSLAEIKTLLETIHNEGGYPQNASCALARYWLLGRVFSEEPSNSSTSGCAL